ncbi:MAG: YhjD/YihY/BrkB family envelope integrity protein [Deltaproteobacteria bacterium]|nr:YhjD/YihY/BrkB family envelope integrity protein [Deltaproteobacteria bacterium]
MSRSSQLASIVEVLAAIRHFFDVDVWERDHSQHKGMVWFLLRQLQVVLLVVKGLREDKIFVRANALAFVTLLSIVPFLAVIFSIFQALGGLTSLRESVQKFIYDNLAVGSDSQLVSWLDGLIAKFHGGAVGGIGVALLLYGSIRLMIATEAAFDGIWGVRRKRSLLYRVVVYWSLMTLGPILLALSLATTAALRGWLGSGTFAGLAGLFGLVPALLSVLGFALLYLIVPNTRVKVRHALIGGLIAGALFEGAKWGYAWVAAHLFSYNALYGSLGAIPVFIIWVNICWILLLFGCELTFANQNVNTLRLEQRARDASTRTREILAARLMLEVASAFHDGGDPPQAASCSERLGAPVRLVREVLDQLRDAGLVREALAGATDSGWLPARVLEQISVGDVVGAVRGSEQDVFKLTEGPGSIELEALQVQAEALAAESLDKITYQALARDLREG